MVYVPFEQHQSLDRGPWLPLPEYDDNTHEEEKRKFGNYVEDGVKGKDLEMACRRILRALILLVPHRMDRALEPSGLWVQWCGSEFLVDGFGEDIGLLYDDLSLALARTSPSPHWYTRLLAARDTLHSHWCRTPRSRTRVTTTTLITLSNVLSALDLRFCRFVTALYSVCLSTLASSTLSR